jgi:hypothetical protein
MNDAIGLKAGDLSDGSCAFDQDVGGRPVFRARKVASTALLLIGGR